MIIESDRKFMDGVTNTIIGVASKPMTGASIGVGAMILSYIGIISTIVGCIATIVGLIAAIYSLLHNRNLVKEDEKRMGTK